MKKIGVLSLWLIIFIFMLPFVASSAQPNGPASEWHHQKQTQTRLDNKNPDIATAILAKYREYLQNPPGYFTTCIDYIEWMSVDFIPISIYIHYDGVLKGYWCKIWGGTIYSYEKEMDRIIKEHNRMYLKEYEYNRFKKIGKL